jgi:hypothetical protein
LTFEPIDKRASGYGCETPLTHEPMDKPLQLLGLLVQNLFDDDY